MTKQHKPSPDQSFVGSKLPWVLAGAAFLLYLLTLNHWISLSNLGFVARGAGWAWGVDVYNPVFFLLTLPIRALPVSIMPLAYNLFSAVCGALAAALLARSAVILPHNRTQDQRLRERNPLGLLSNDFAWLPPLFAGLVFILQLTVWENSTTGSNDVVDVLLVAYIINNLLEYRLDEKDSRLFRAALVCGAAMANSWLVFVLFPAFLASVIWIKKLEFFNARFLLRMLLFGVLGTLFYLLLPTVQAMSSEHLITFGAALKMNLAMDKQTFVFFFRRAPLSLDVMLIVTSLLPLLIIGIRWASNFGDPSKMGTAITKLVFHVTHLGLLLVLLWMAFDPVFSPRRKGFALTPFSFIASLGIGYLVGYFLIVFRPLPERMGRSTSLQIALNRVSIGLSFALLVIVPLGLLLRNLPQVRLTNGPALKDYATQLVEN
ncbi:MAG TPA: hypothetical protein VK327_06310, partial [Candidatus Paceibacterota bacterium]|nr:hypothetical protein [Candidatus Paceibacterota bacterium]